MITLAKHMSAISIWPRFTNIMKTFVPLKLERVGSAPASNSFSHATLLLPAEAWNKRLKSAWNELVEVIYDYPSEVNLAYIFPQVECVWVLQIVKQRLQHIEVLRFQDGLAKLRLLLSPNVLH